MRSSGTGNGTVFGVMTDVKVRVIHKSRCFTFANWKNEMKRLLTYWRQQGFEDGLLGYKKTKAFFIGAQQMQHYEEYLSGHRAGQMQRRRI